MSRKFNALAENEPSAPKRDAEIHALLQQAIALHKQNSYQKAIACYSDILRIEPLHYDAVNLLGVVAYQTGNHQLAIALAEQAIGINPTNAEAHVNRGNALKALDQLEAAVDSFDQAIALDRHHASAYNNRGAALQRLNRLEEALASYDKAVRINPDYVDAHYNRGLVLQELKQFNAAVESYDKAIALNPNHAVAYNNRGNALKELTQFKSALESYDNAIRLQPNDPVTYYNRGNTLHELRQFQAALENYDLAIRLQPDFAEAYVSRGITLSSINRFSDSAASFEKAISIKPELADIHHKYGNLLSVIGRQEDARKALCKAIELDPGNCAAYFDLANAWKFSAGDRYLEAMEQLVRTADGPNRIHLDFALGKAYEDIKDYRHAFTHLLAGNAAKRATLSYDESAKFRLFDRIEQIFTPELMEEKAGSGEPSARPIFVLGMPRSGTTLVEQLLASHPAVHGAGELMTLNDVLLTVPDSEGNPVHYPEFVPTLDRKALDALGTDYIRRLAALAPDGERVTDKMPGNFVFVGLIHLVLPNAVIIHTMRNPVDTCVSCFSKLFTSGQEFSYELGELGRYYARYHRLMGHWRRLLPPGRILDVCYEDVVDDLEGQARRILAHCRLSWDDRCLAFHKSDRPVFTASLSQVRQPIYKTAIDRWLVYQNDLAPLVSALEKLTEQD